MAGVVMVLDLAAAARAARAGSGPLAAPAVLPLAPEAGRELVRVAVADVRQRFATGTAPDGTRWRPLRYARAGGGGSKPLVDTGALAASVRGRATGDEVAVGTTHPGAALHQFGGTVVPRRGKFLSIPLTAAAKRAGSPRAVRGTPAVPLFARRGPTGRLVGHFLLVRRAVVPARPFLGLSDEAAAKMGEILADAAARTWRG